LFTHDEFIGVEVVGPIGLVFVPVPLELRDLMARQVNFDVSHCLILVNVSLRIHFAHLIDSHIVHGVLFFVVNWECLFFSKEFVAFREDLLHFFLSGSCAHNHFV